jgi:ankyrin repeat protein
MLPINSKHFIACINGYKEIVKIFLENGAYVYERDNDERSSLLLGLYHSHRILCITNINFTFIAALNGRQEVVEFLLEKGADIKAIDNDGQSAWLLGILYLFENFNWKD